MPGQKCFFMDNFFCIIMLKQIKQVGGKWPVCPLKPAIELPAKAQVCTFLMTGRNERDMNKKCKVLYANISQFTLCIEEKEEEEEEYKVRQLVAESSMWGSANKKAICVVFSINLNIYIYTFKVDYIG